MNPTLLLKGVAGAALLATWAFLVYIGKADAPSLVEFIKGALLLLGGHTVFNKGDPKS